MSIDWQHFTPGLSLAGGVLIGIATAFLWWFNGRVAGVSGIVAGVLLPNRADIFWRLAFVSGLFLAPQAYGLYAALPQIRIESDAVLLIVAGLLVGIGTQYGGGCTSGHGVCGLSRFSLRSLIATLSFMTAGFMTVFILRHLLGGAS